MPQLRLLILVFFLLRVFQDYCVFLEGYRSGSSLMNFTQWKANPFFPEPGDFHSIADFIFRMLTENVDEKIPFTRKMLRYFDQMMNIIHNNYLPLEKEQPSDKEIQTDF